MQACPPDSCARRMSPCITSMETVCVVVYAYPSCHGNRALVSGGVQICRIDAGGYTHGASSLAPSIVAVPRQRATLDEDWVSRSLCAAGRLAPERGPAYRWAPTGSAPLHIQPTLPTRAWDYCSAHAILSGPRARTVGAIDTRSARCEASAAQRLRETQSSSSVARCRGTATMLGARDEAP